MRPPGAFTLRPSQGSAFCPPDRIATEEMCGATALQVCPHQSGGTTSELCPMCGSSSGSSPSGCPDVGSLDSDLQQHVPRACQPSPSQSATCEATGVSIMVLGSAHTSIGASPELTADQ